MVIWTHKRIYRKHLYRVVIKTFSYWKRNQRDTGLATGDEQGIKLGHKYDEYANMIMPEYPKIASIVWKIGKSYSYEAKGNQLREMKDFG